MRLATIMGVAVLAMSGTAIAQIAKSPPDVTGQPLAQATDNMGNAALNNAVMPDNAMTPPVPDNMATPTANPDNSVLPDQPARLPAVPENSKSDAGTAGG